jgi:hypothetical protein
MKGRVSRSAFVNIETASMPRLKGWDGASRPVSRVLSGVASATAIPLGRGLLSASSNQPGRWRGSRWARGFATRPYRPYSVLLPVGFAVPLPLPDARCALTAPFHPCRCG